VFGKKSQPWAFAALKSLFMAVIFLCAGTILGALVAFGHRDRKEKNVQPVWWVRLIARMLGPDAPEKK
jgi:hypothetical protein